MSLSCRDEDETGNYQISIDDCTNYVNLFPFEGNDQVWTDGSSELATPDEPCNFPVPLQPGRRELRSDTDQEFRDGTGQPIWGLSIQLESTYVTPEATYSSLSADVQPSCSEPMTVRLLDDLRALPPRCRTVTEIVDGSIVVTEVCDGPRECVFVGSFEVEVAGEVHIVHYSADNITIDFDADGSIDRVLDDCLADELATCDQRESTPAEE